MRSLVGKNKDFKGPKTHHGIIQQIHKEAKVRNNLSVNYIERVVKLYFGGYYGIAKHYRKGNNFKIFNLGWFRPTSERRAIAIKKKIKAGMKFKAKEKIRQHNIHLRRKARRAEEAKQINDN